MTDELTPALVLQSVILVLASMILDGGAIFQVCFFAFVAFWGGLGVMHVRGKGALTKLDVLLIRYGYLPACIISFFVTIWIWHLRGYDNSL